LLPYDSDHSVLSKTRVNPAVQQICRKSRKLDEGDPSAFLAIDPQRARGEARGFYVLGYFVYRDRMRRFYRTAFCRRYDPTMRIFEATGNPDYEYED
jgi:hypothetical protein